MSNLTLVSPQSSFPSLLNLTSPSSGLTNVLQIVQDGLGNNSPISLSTLSFRINTTMGGFYIDNNILSSTAPQIDAVCRNSSFSGFTGALTIPIGTTAQQPALPENGDFRYNNETHQFEGYKNGAWVNFTTA